MMVVEIALPHGKNVTILNMHFSYHKAKKEPGYVRGGYDVVINKLEELIKRHGVDLLVGDFNGAADSLIKVLEKRNITATIEHKKGQKRRRKPKTMGNPSGSTKLVRKSFVKLSCRSGVYARTKRHIPR